MNQAVKRWVAVEPRPQSVMVLVSTGAGGWACLKRICVVCFSIQRRGAKGGGGRGLVGFPKYPPDPARPRPQSVLEIVNTGVDWSAVVMAHVFASNC